MSPAQASRVPEVQVQRAADLFNSLLAQGEDALAPYRRDDYRAPCGCGDEREKHTGPVNTGKCTGCDRCARFREDMTHVRVHTAVKGMDARFVDLLRAQRRADYEKRPREERQPGEWIVRFSDVGGCGRQIGYRNFHPELAVPKYDGPALAGDVVEAAVRRVNSREFSWREYQREVRHPAIPRPGKIDEWDPVLGMVIDTKSCGDWKWEQATVFGTLEANLKQVCLYALALELSGVKVNFVRVHYVHRENFDEDFERHTYPWDDKMRAVAKKALVELAGRQGQLDITEETGELPERDRLGPTDPLCRYCEFFEACWNTKRAEELGATPERVTLLGEEPDENEIERACEIIVAKRRARDEAEREYKAANNMIDYTIRPGQYGARGRVDANGQGGKILYAQWVPLLFEWAAREHGLDLSEAGRPPRSGPGKPIAKLVGQTTARKNAARAARNAARQKNTESDGGTA